MADLSRVVVVPAKNRAIQRLDRADHWPQRPDTYTRSKHRASKPPRRLVVAHRRRRARANRRSRS